MDVEQENVTCLTDLEFTPFDSALGQSAEGEK